MRMLQILLPLFVWSVALPLAAQTPAATQVLTKAKAQAAEQHKSIFLMFDASWWGWCKRLDKFIETPEIKSVLEKHFVFTKLVVQEHGEKEKLNHPGGDSVMETVGGKGAGLPFIAFLDAKGELITNGLRPGKGNIGHPFAPEEVDWFMQMLAKAAPGMTAAEKTTIDGWLRSQKK